METNVEPTGTQPLKTIEDTIGDIIKKTRRNTNIEQPLKKAQSEQRTIITRTSNTWEAIAEDTPDNN